MYKHQRTLAVRLLLLLLISALISACSLTAPAEEEPITFTGPPVVRIAAPAEGDTYLEGAGVQILVNVSNAGPDIARVAIMLDGQVLGESLEPNAEAGAASFTVNSGWPASGVGQHTITAVASRLNGETSANTSVTINVVGAATSDDSSQASDTNTDTTTDTTQPTDVPPPSNTTAPVDTNQTGTGGDTPTEQATQAQEQPTDVPPPTATNTVAPTNTLPPTNTPAPTATNTPARPQVRVTTGANVRSGPGLVFDPPVGSLAAGAMANILAVSLDGSWYKIQYYAGDAWISNIVVEVVGNVSNLPREAGPPTPIPATNTPVPPTATATPNTTVDLSITNVVTNPSPFVCNQSSEVRVTVTNSGTTASPSTRVVLEDLYNGQVVASTEGPVSELQPGASTTITMYLTVSTFIAEAHTSRQRVDPDNTVPETNEGNNSAENVYVLATGGC